jgi:hypothetical protein
MSTSGVRACAGFQFFPAARTGQVVTKCRRGLFVTGPVACEFVCCDFKSENSAVAVFAAMYPFPVEKDCAVVLTAELFPFSFLAVT